MDLENNDGAYQFLPEWNDSQPILFGQLNSDITFQRGDLIDQWTATFEDKVTDERGIILIRFAPRFWGDIIEFEVLLNPIPIDDF